MFVLHYEISRGVDIYVHPLVGIRSQEEFANESQQGFDVISRTES